MLIAREETFGPVAPVVEVADDAEALALTNASPYGLLTAVFTAGPRPGAALRRGRPLGLGQHQRLDQLLGEPPALRRPGRAALSGRGRVGGATVLEQLSELKTIVYPA